MAVDRDIRVWVPGALKESSGYQLLDTSIVFEEAVIHPSSNNPFAVVSTDEEDVLNFTYFYLTALFDHQMTLQEADRPKDFSLRRTYFSNQTTEGLSVNFVVSIPLETTLLFGRKETA